MTHYLQDLLSEVFRAEGTPDPEQVAERALAALMRVEVLPATEVDRFERDARIYELRGQGLGPAVLAARLNVHRCHITKVVRRHSRRRRAILRLVS